MHTVRFLALSLAVLALAGCPADDKDTGDTGGDTGADTGDTSETADTSDTGDTSDTSDTGDTSGDTSDTGDTGDTAAPTCDGTPCGGDPVGNWTVVEACADASGIQIPDCPSATVEVRDFSYAGTIAIESTGTVTSLFTRSVTLGAVLPDSCIGGATCAQIGAAMDGTCVDAAGGCDCELTRSGTVADESPWEVNGTVFQTYDEDGNPNAPIDFCVDTDTLWYSGALSEEEGLTITVVAQRD